MNNSISRIFKRKKFLRAWDFPGFLTWTFFFFGFLYIPIVILVIYSFNSSKFAMIWTGFSFRWYEKLLTNDDMQQATLNSLYVAFVAAPCATAIATVTALVIVRGGSFRSKDLSNGLVTLPLMVPEIVTAVATLIFFAFVGINLGLINVMIAHTVFCIPFAYMPIKASLEAMDPTLEIAARDLYSDRNSTFRYITLPLLMPGILSGFMLAFVISIDDFIITLMVAGGGSTTLPVYIYSMIKMGVTPEVNAISTLLLGFSIILVSGYWILSKKR
tara:strand:+ start:710 stop:1528 length:819 start_codon:yes stop_codon:yes gene_type:complete